MKVNLKKSIVLFFGTVLYLFFVSLIVGDNFVSFDEEQGISAVVQNEYPQYLKDIKERTFSEADTVELRRLEAEYYRDMPVKNISGVIVHTRNIREYSIGIIFGFIVALVFLLKYFKSRNSIEADEEKFGSNFIIYLCLYIISPIIISTFHFFDLWLGWTTSGVFIPLGLTLGTLITIVVFFATTVYFIRTAKNYMSTRILFWRIVEPILWIVALVFIYVAYFELVP